MISEALLHYAWKHSIYSHFDFKTSDGQPLQIIHPGLPHQDAGPDFKQAVVKIGDLLWTGNVEIHVKSSDWLKHRHHEDAKYETVILHVVYEHDYEINYKGGSPIPTFELKNHLSSQLIERYTQLMLSTSPLPCAQFVQNLKAHQPDYYRLIFHSLYARLILERLEQRSKDIFATLNQVSGDWNETLFRLLTANFGFKTNRDAFVLLAQSIPYKLIQKHATNQLQIEAILFGQAGLLEEPLDDAYYETLQEEYEYLRRKERLHPIHPKNWNLLRLRPQNFPCMRLAQLSAILFRYPNLFTTIEHHTEITQFAEIFSIPANSYWETHYQFGKESKKHATMIGENTFQLLIINTIIPALYVYGIFSGKEELSDRAIDLLSQMEAEDNKIIRFYRENHFEIDNGMESQAVLELSKRYCQHKQCLACSLGSKIVSEDDIFYAGTPQNQRPNE